MQRIVVLGRCGAGKTTTAVRLGRALALPVLELDRYFWSDDLVAMPPEQWARVQEELAAADRWVLDGDLGPYDHHATTSLERCPLPSPRPAPRPGRSPHHVRRAGPGAAGEGRWPTSPTGSPVISPTSPTAA